LALRIVSGIYFLYFVNTIFSLPRLIELQRDFSGEVSVWNFVLPSLVLVWGALLLYFSFKKLNKGIKWLLVFGSLIGLSVLLVSIYVLPIYNLYSIGVL